MNNSKIKTLNFAHNNGDELLTELTSKWLEIESWDGVFKYKLNVGQHKTLPGKYKFYIEYNPDRTTLRRAPDAIPSITPSFNENGFNFNKINSQETLLHINYLGNKITFLINNSPLTRYHSLICPNLAMNLPQILTKEALEFAVVFLRSLNCDDFKIGYNSPGALASVNHLHLHLLQIREKLYIEDALLTHLTKNLYKLKDDEYPAKGFCFLITQENDTEIYKDVMKLIDFFCENQIPHNIFIANGWYGGTKCLKLFLFPRQKMCAAKEFSTFNVAFCELSGYIPIGNIDVYEAITEEDILIKMNADMGNIIREIESNVIALYT